VLAVYVRIFLESSILDTAVDKKFATAVGTERPPMSARRRRRSNSNSKDDASNSYSDYSVSGTSVSMSTMSLPPPASPVAGEMGCRDRTHEFRSITMSLRSNQVMQAFIQVLMWNWDSKHISVTCIFSCGSRVVISLV